MDGDLVLNISAPAAAAHAGPRRPPPGPQKKRPREPRSEGPAQRSGAAGAKAPEPKLKLVRPEKKQQPDAAAGDAAPAKFVKGPPIVGIKGPRAAAAGKPGKNKPADAKGVQTMGAKHRPLSPAERPPIRIPGSAQKRPLSAASGNAGSDSEQGSAAIVTPKQRQPVKKVKKDVGSPPVAFQRAAPQLEDDHAGKVDETAEATPVKPSRKRPAASDTRVHHLKPSDLSKDALPKPKVARESRHLFTEASFESLGLCEKLVSLLTKPTEEGGFGFQSATKVQSVAVPVLLRNTRALIKSETGSGKTLTYLLPLIQDLQSWNPKIDRASGTWAIILAPTRELSVQIFDVLSQLTKRFAWLVPSMITGGEKRKSEKARLRKGVTIIVATPGRLLDHLQTTESFECSNLRWLILDEADRLLDLGFEKQLNAILDILMGRALEQLAELEKSVRSQPQKHRHRNQEEDDGEHYGEKGGEDDAADDAEDYAEQEDDADEEDVAGVADDADGAYDAQQHDDEDDDEGRPSRGKKGGNDGSQAQGPAIVLPVLGDKKLFTASQRWHARKALQAKKCKRLDHLHTILASATLTPAVGRLAGSLLGDHIFIDADREHMESSTKQALMNRIANPDAQGPNEEEASTFSAPVQLRQYAMVVTCKWRLPALAAFIKQHSNEKVIVFMSTCDSVDFHMLLMREARWPQSLDDKQGADGGENKEEGAGNALRPLRHTAVGMFGYNCPIFRLHGNLTAETRNAAFKEFAEATAGVLFCTDVAARGLDLPKVDWILQYDPPIETSDYVHRVGRTARRGACGSALLFVLPSEKEYLDVLKSHGLNADLLSLHQLLQDTTRFLPSAASYKNADEMAAVILQRRFENTVAASKALLASAKSAFQSFLRAYSTHSSATKHIFQLRALHFGHVAKSFAMREPPSAIRVSGATVASASKPLKDSNKKKKAAKVPAPSGKFRKGSAVGGGKAAAEFAS